MPGKHLLVETEDGGEVGIPDGTLQTPSHPGIVKNRVGMVCIHVAMCSPTRECRCGGPCGQQHICDDKAEEEWQNENERHKMEDIELGSIALHG